MEKEKKENRYARLYFQIDSLMSKSSDINARMATIVAILHNKLNYFFWTGFYCLNNEKLIVRTYQGPVACQELKKDTGVCWAGINRQKTIIVENVDNFPDHIACDSRSKSEIVVPVFSKQGIIIGVLDVDSTKLNSFDLVDAEWLEKIVKLIYV